mmetsp:Transcript_11149/g.31419  ORF Transcript_11149/g.31419 Transcript_11149/m.31419 type:complete len:289 (-) Transcript_11149:285-1151(-)
MRMSSSSSSSSGAAATRASCARAMRTSAFSSVFPSVPFSSPPPSPPPSLSASATTLALSAANMALGRAATISTTSPTSKSMVSTTTKSCQSTLTALPPMPIPMPPPPPSAWRLSSTCRPYSARYAAMDSALDRAAVGFSVSVVVVLVRAVVSWVRSSLPVFAPPLLVSPFLPSSPPPPPTLPVASPPPVPPPACPSSSRYKSTRAVKYANSALRGCRKPNTPPPPAADDDDDDDDHSFSVRILMKLDLPPSDVDVEEEAREERAAYCAVNLMISIWPDGRFDGAVSVV